MVKSSKDILTEVIHEEFAKAFAREIVRELADEIRTGERNRVHNVPDWGSIPLQFMEMFSVKSMIEMDFVSLLKKSNIKDEDLIRNGVYDIAKKVGW